jgi:hypothetical protein
MKETTMATKETTRPKPPIKAGQSKEASSAQLGMDPGRVTLAQALGPAAPGPGPGLPGGASGRVPVGRSAPAAASNSVDGASNPYQDNIDNWKKFGGTVPPEVASLPGPRAKAFTNWILTGEEPQGLDDSNGPGGMDRGDWDTAIAKYGTDDPFESSGSKKGDSSDDSDE